jgi:hypothetical protein
LLRVEQRKEKMSRELSYKTLDGTYVKVGRVEGRIDDFFFFSPNYFCSCSPSQF